MICKAKTFRGAAVALPEGVTERLEAEGTELKVIGDNCGHSVEGVKLSTYNNSLVAELDCDTFECDKYHCNLGTQTRVSSMNIAFREKGETVWKTFANLNIMGGAMAIGNVCNTIQ